MGIEKDDKDIIHLNSIDNPSYFRTASILIFIMFISECIIGILFQIPALFVALLTAGFFIPVFVFLILHNLMIKNNFRNNYLRNIICVSVNKAVSLIELYGIFEEFLVRFYKENASLPAISDSIKKEKIQFELLTDELKTLKNYPERLSKIKPELIENKIMELDNVSNKLKNDIIEFINDTNKSFFALKGTIIKNNNNFNALLLYLHLAIPMLGDFTKIFNEFSKNIVIEVINKFEEIITSSRKIAEEIESSMTNLMNSESVNSLAFILKKAGNLVKDFENFYKNMETLKVSSSNYTDKSAEKLKNIQDIATSIENIAETIRVLSLNVSIEAVNAGEFGKGFQVLSRDLRDFTTKTINFAAEVKTRVKDALSSTNNLKDDFTHRMEKVYAYIDDIKSSITSFDEIIKISFDRIEEIILDIKKFSVYIDSGIKDVIGKLQYYDITSQEIEHLKVFMDKLYGNFIIENNINVEILDSIDEKVKNQAKMRLLKIMKGIITTSNERKVIEKYEIDTGYIEQENIQIENKAPDEIKDSENSIILF